MRDKKNRLRAAEFARLYRERRPWVHIGQDDAGNHRFRPLTGDDLAEELEHFAEHGAFRPDGLSIPWSRDLLIRADYKRLLPTRGQAAAFRELAAKYRVTESTIDKALYRDVVMPDGTTIPPWDYSKPSGS